MATTRGAIRVDAARLVGLLAFQGTATGGSTSTLVDATARNGGLKSSADSNYLYEGAYLLMTSGAELGNWREIGRQGLAPLTGTVTLATAFTTGPSAGDTYEIYTGLTPDQWSLQDTRSIVDLGLQRCRYLTRSPLTLVTDGDMEASGVTNWTASSATLAKSTSDAVTDGAQSLVVTNTGTNGYAQSASLSVIPNTSYSVWADYRATTTTKATASLIVWDVTNGVQIAAGSDADGGVNFEGGMLQTGFTVPATCYRVAIRLQGAESTAVIAWDDVIVMNTQRSRYTAPSWVANRNQILDWETRAGSRPLSYVWGSVGYPLRVEQDPTAVTTFRVNLPLGLGAQPVYCYGERAFGPMSATTDATASSIDPEWASYAVAGAAYDKYSLQIESASQSRVRMDRAVIETRLQSMNDEMMPWDGRQHRVGFQEPWIGGFGAGGSYVMPS